MVGKIVSIENHGTIIMVWVENEDGVYPIYFDHRPFSNMWEAEGGDIVGRQVEYDNSGEEDTMKFLD